MDTKIMCVWDMLIYEVTQTFDIDKTCSFVYNSPLPT